jgi:hypothetical protein
VRYGFDYDRNGDAVFYWRSVHAIWYTPMDLRAFPFDQQNLLVQASVRQRLQWLRAREAAAAGLRGAQCSCSKWRSSTRVDHCVHVYGTASQCLTK